MSQDRSKPNDESVKYLKAIMLLQLNQLMDEAERMKPEVVLTNAGFVQREIAEFLGKSQPAISKSISRAKQQ